jgi:hypothetical protein
VLLGTVSGVGLYSDVSDVGLYSDISDVGLYSDVVSACIQTSLMLACVQTSLVSACIRTSLMSACIQTSLVSAFFTVVVDDIVDVRKGWKTDTFNKIERRVSKKRIGAPGQKPTLDESVCFSVVHGRSKHSLDLVAPNAEVANLWVRGLRHLVTVLHGMKQGERFERWVHGLDIIRVGVV